MVEVNGKNKNDLLLVAVYYQPSSFDKDKEARLEKFDKILALLTVKWNVQMIVTGNFNINLLSESQIIEKDSEILKLHAFIQHIEEPTRSGKKLINHISWNLKKFTSQNVPCDEISNHNVPYVLVNIRKIRFKLWYKYKGT